ncbi:MAG: hypothetical protein HFH82_14880 [Lachnospiraceae bacterium]|nr:hypothetical protein [Lachnospiraceae bacterium]
MRIRRPYNGICYFFIILLLIYGMSAGHVRPDSFFSCAEASSCSTVSDRILHNSVLNPAEQRGASEQLYMAESFRHCETAFTSRYSVRNMGLRMSKWGSLTLSLTNFLSFSFSGGSFTAGFCFFREVISNMVIISYIHRQDGDKHSIL